MHLQAASMHMIPTMGDDKELRLYYVVYEYIGALLRRFLLLYCNRMIDNCIVLALL